jgi:hypothetical protein
MKFFKSFIDLFLDENQIKVFFLYAHISKNAPLKVYYKEILLMVKVKRGELVNFKAFSFAGVHNTLG